MKRPVSYSSAGRLSRSDTAGFTLIELLVVIASDRSIIPSDPKRNLPAFERFRSIAMNGRFGGKTSKLREMLGPELGFSRYGNCYRKLSDMLERSPSQAWLFLDEHPNWIIDGFFDAGGPAFRDARMEPARWIELPANFHAGGAGISFADGHARINKWRDPKTIEPPVEPTPNRDLSWLVQYGQEPATNVPFEPF